MGKPSMMIEFGPKDRPYDSFGTLEMPMPPRVGETVKMFVREQSRWRTFEILAVRYQQMEKDRVIMATHFGMVDVVAAVCTVKDAPDEDEDDVEERDEV